MSLTTKFFLFFSTAALIPLIFVSFFSYYQARDTATNTAITKLSVIANLQKNRIEELATRYLEQAELVASRGQVRNGLLVYEKNDTSSASAQIQTTIEAAKSSVSDIVSITVYARDGQVVASTEKALLGKKYPGTDFDMLLKSSAQFKGLFKSSSNQLYGKIFAPITINTTTLGIAEINLSADPLIAITEDYAGLGDSGETIIAEKNASGDAIFLTPLRFDAGAALRRGIPSDAANVPVLSAIQGVENTFTVNSIDYRDKSIFAVTRYIAPLAWGIVVKIDRAEIFAPIDEMRYFIFIICIFAACLSLIISYALAGHISRPIISLTKAASRLEHGTFDHDVMVNSHDEIGKLGESFNIMAHRLEENYQNLEQKIADRTKELTISKESLEKNLQETERLNRLMIGREIKIQELKTEIEKSASKKENKKIKTTKQPPTV